MTKSWDQMSGDEKLDELHRELWALRNALARRHTEHNAALGKIYDAIKEIEERLNRDHEPSKE